MIRKLFSLVSGLCCPDNPDSPQHQEILLPGVLYGMIIKEKLEETLSQVQNQITQDLRRDQSSVNFFDGMKDPFCQFHLLHLFTERYTTKVFNKVNFDIGAKMSNFLATGNLSSPSGLDLQQTAGFTILAEKLNWLRYISHFRCVHRGAFFAELKTTAVRKLLPEAWGEAYHSATRIVSFKLITQVSFVQCTPQMAHLVVYSITFQDRVELLHFP
jgi:DNA-directed RNA polymerase I subunit RPA2